MRCRFPIVVAMSSRPSYQNPGIARDSQTFNPRNQFRYPPPYVQNQHRQFRNPSPFVQNQHTQIGQLRPQPPPHQHHRPPKPLDFRNWEYAKPAPPPNSERFTVLSYNILADYLAINHRSQLYFHIPHHMLDWQWRKRNIIFELGLWSADIMCFQEVDRFHELEEELKKRGYCGIWKMRTGNPVDGCAIFWRMSKFKLLHEECIEFNKLGLRDNVAQIFVLELTSNKNTAAQSLTRTTGSNKVVICNIHVLYNPKRGEVKLGQIPLPPTCLFCPYPPVSQSYRRILRLITKIALVRVLLQRAYAVSKLWDDAPLVLCGDFNCTPKSPLYNFISEQKIILSKVDRDKVSGQASAEIRSPRSYNHNPGAQTVDYSIQPPSTIEGSEVRKETSFPSVTQKLNNLDKVDQMNKVVQKFTLSVSLNSEDVLASDILDSTEVSSHESSGNLSSQSNGNNEQDGSSFFDEAVESSSLDEQHRDKVEGGNIGDPQLQIPSREVLNGLSSGLDSEKTYYDRSRWTPVEIETATGKAGCTILEHPIKLRSTYTDVEDCSGTRDSSGEPMATSYNRSFFGTVDYIWCSEGIKTVRVLAPLPKQAMQWTPGFPTKKWGSDHIALVSELAFAKH